VYEIVRLPQGSKNFVMTLAAGCAGRSGKRYAAA